MSAILVHLPIRGVPEACLLINSRACQIISELTHLKRNGGALSTFAIEIVWTWSSVSCVICVVSLVPAVKGECDL